MKYNYLVVDAQLVLTRNFHRVRNSGHLTKGGLIKSFIQSIVKLCREVPTSNVILAWDRSPYHRHQMMEDYKGDRKYYTKDDITDDLPQEEKDRIEKEINDFKLRNEVKYYLVNHSPKLGMTSLLHQGYEADDLAYISVRNLPGKICIASSDSDWRYLLIDGSDHYNLKSKFTSFTDLKEESGDVDPFLYKSALDSLYASHNFLKDVSNGKFDIESVINLMQMDNYSFTSDRDLFLCQLKSFGVSKFPDYELVCEKVKKMSTDFTRVMTESEFSQFTIDNHITITNKYFTDHINRLKDE